MFGMIYYSSKGHGVYSTGSGVMHPARCLTRTNLALFSGEPQPRRLQCSGASRVELGIPRP